MEEASVAGESPDRSKQRESSAEPTSGSKVPVPDSGTHERDPRLAVARENGSSTPPEPRGGVDTATRVFSVRELKTTAEPVRPTEEQGDGEPTPGGPEASAPRARRPEDEGPGAGAPGVRVSETGEPEDATPEAGAPRDTAPEAGEPGDAAPGAEEREDAALGAEAAERDARERKAGQSELKAGEPEAEQADARERRVAEPGTEGSEARESDARERTAGEPEAGRSDARERKAGESRTERSELRAGQPRSEPKAEAPEDAAPGAGEPEAAEAEDSGAEGAATVGDADASEGAVSAGEADDAATGEGEEGGDARLRAAVAAWVRSGDAKDTEEPEGAETAAEGDEEAAPETAAQTGPDADSDAEAGQNADESEPAADESAAASDVEEAPQDAVPDAGEAPQDAVPAAGEELRDAVPDVEEMPQDAVPHEGEAPQDAVPAAGEELRDAAPDAGEAPQDAVPGAERTPQGAVPDADADAGSGADGEPVVDAAREADDDGPAVADGRRRPKGPPAADDQSGTGGAGGDARPEGEDSEPPVDQPTAIFKRPKPQVDQPTTMLKLGGTPKAPKEPKAPDPSEAERTSKFVALKPLDQPPAMKPADATAAVPQVGPERTAQQPLPPKPPLDLLAELTNTPPPPQTPVRTLVRRIKIWTPLVLLLAVVFAIAQAVRPLPTPTLSLTADDSYTFDGTKAALPWPNEGQGRLDVNGIGTMGNFGKQTPVAIGSVAKAMTAYIVLKDHPLKRGAEGEKITVDALAEKEGGYDKDGESTLNTVKKGDVLTEKQALSAIMIPSANNIARLLARWDAGSEAAFIKKMNVTAKKLGMTGTTYTDASGLKETTVSTAEDQVKLGNQLVKIPALMDITKLPNWVDPSGQKWDNYNRLVPYNGAIGIKTGTTTKAGGNLLFAATKAVGGETVTVVGAILGQHTAPIIDTVNAVSKTAMLAAQDALKSAKILKKGDVVGYVDDQLGGHTPIVVTKDVTAVGWSGYKVKLSFDADDLPHTAKAGTQVGTLTVGDGTSGAVQVPVALQKDLTEPGYAAKLKRIT